MRIKLASTDTDTAEKALSFYNDVFAHRKELHPREADNGWRTVASPGEPIRAELQSASHANRAPRASRRAIQQGRRAAVSDTLGTWVGYERIRVRRAEFTTHPTKFPSGSVARLDDTQCYPVRTTPLSWSGSHLLSDPESR